MQKQKTPCHEFLYARKRVAYRLGYSDYFPPCTRKSWIQNQTC